MRRLRVVHSLAGLLIAGLLVGCQTGTPPAPATPEPAGEVGEVTLTLLSTNDFHGALLPVRDRKSKRQMGGAVALAAAIDNARRENPEGTLLLDAGDSFQGTPMSNRTEGRASIEFLNLVGFEATAVGNHAFDWGVPVLEERMAQADFPFLSANIRDKTTGERPSWAVPYKIFERQGVRVAVIGLTTVGTPRTTLPQHVETLEFLDPAPIANALITELVPAQADLAVLLCHIGLRKPDSDDPTGELRPVLRQIRGAAAVIGGHTHEVFAGELDGFPVVQASDSGKYLGRIDLVYDRQTRQVVRHAVRSDPVNAEEDFGRSAVSELVDRERFAYEEAMREVLGTASTDLEWVGDRECRIGNLFTDAIREQMGVDFVFQNPFGLRASLAAGEITRGDVFEVLPFDNTIVRVELTRDEILELLEQAADRTRLLYVSGLRYRADRTRPVGSRVTLETDLADGRRYQVAINNFMAQGGDGLKVLANRPEARETGVLLRDALSDWIVSQTRQGQVISAEIDGRSRVDGP